MPELYKVATLPKRKPLSINYSVGGTKTEKQLDANDFALSERIANASLTMVSDEPDDARR